MSGHIIDYDTGAVSKIENSTKSATASRAVDLLSSLDHSANRIAESIRNEGERNRLQMLTLAEKTEYGFSQTNYNLVKIAHSIGNLPNEFRQSTDVIVRRLQSVSSSIVSALDKNTGELNLVNRNLQQIDNSLEEIKSVVRDIAKMISRPNEVEALEFADQARLHLALDENAHALRLTRKAHDKCATSVTVSSYFLISLSRYLQEDSKLELEEAFEAYIRLVRVLLKEAPSALEQIRSELLHFSYITVASVYDAMGPNCIASVEKLFEILAEDETIAFKLLEKPLIHGPTTQMMSREPLIKNYLWDFIFRKRIVAFDDQQLLLIYIRRLLLDDTPLKNEFAFIACKYGFNNGLIEKLLVKHWSEESISQDEHRLLKLFFCFNYAEKINLSNHLVMMIDRYITDFDLTYSKFFGDLVRQYKIEFEQAIQSEFISKCHSVNNQFIERQAAYSRECKEIAYKLEKQVKNMERENIEKNRNRKNKIQSLEKKSNEVQNKIEEREQTNFLDIPEFMGGIIGVVLGFVIAAMLNENEFGFGSFVLGIIFSYVSYWVAGANIVKFGNEYIGNLQSENRSKILESEKQLKELKSQIADIKNQISDETKKIEQFKKNNLDDQISKAVKSLKNIRDESLNAMRDKYDNFLMKYFPVGKGMTASKIELDMRSDFASLSRLNYSKSDIETINESLKILSIPEKTIRLEDLLDKK